MPVTQISIFDLPTRPDLPGRPISEVGCAGKHTLSRFEIESRFLYAHVEIGKGMSHPIGAVSLRGSAELDEKTGEITIKTPSGAPYFIIHAKES